MQDGIIDKTAGRDREPYQFDVMAWHRCFQTDTTARNSIIFGESNRSPEELPAGNQAQIIFQMKSGPSTFDPAFRLWDQEPTCKSLLAPIQFQRVLTATAEAKRRSARQRERSDVAVEAP